MFIFNLFVVYLATLSVAETVWCQMTGWLMNYEFEKICKVYGWGMILKKAVILTFNWKK
jgi:hypothetical protein